MESNPYMPTAIQIVLEEDLLRSADRAAKRLKLNRSALFREALRAYIRDLDTRWREELDREGYERVPEHAADLAVWEKVAKWPED